MSTNVWPASRSFSVMPAANIFVRLAMSSGTSTSFHDREYHVVPVTSQRFLRTHVAKRESLCPGPALPKKSIRSGTSRLVLGARAPSPAGACAARFDLKLLDAVTVSRFALIAGEGARAPSISLSLSVIPLLGQGPLALRFTPTYRNFSTISAFLK